MQAAMLADIDDLNRKLDTIFSDWNENIDQVQERYITLDAYRTATLVAYRTSFVTKLDFLIKRDFKSSSEPGIPLRTLNSAVLIKPDISASVIANKHPEKYDVFSQVCQAGAYVSNVRIQKLTDSLVDQVKANSFKCSLRRSFIHADTFRKIPHGSESTVVDCNLQRMLQMIADVNREKLTWQKVNAVMEYSMHLAGGASPEHCLLFGGGSLPAPQILCGSEVKGLESSVLKCFPQLICVCGNSCIEMHRLGLMRENCVVPGIVMAGATCQFLAVYLLRDNFPVLVELTSELSLGKDRFAIAEWCLRLASFASATADLLMSLRQTTRTRTVVSLNMSGYFAKPVRTAWKPLCHQGEEESGGDHSTPLFSLKNTELNHIMGLYERIRLAHKGTDVDVKTLILFPEGVVTVPGEDVPESKAVRSMLLECCKSDHFVGIDLLYCPLILFPRLFVDEGWGISKPTEQHRQGYLGQLYAATTALNTAGVAHLDMRPANIMWRPVPEEASMSCVEIRLIDFEDAELFGDEICPELVSTIIKLGDRRYPFTTGDEKTTQTANKFHNDFFYEAVSQWTASEFENFQEFMALSGAEIFVSTKQMIK